MSRAGLWKAMVPLLAVLAFMFMAALYCFSFITPYRIILKIWGVDWGSESFSPPFLDTDTILSAVRCLSHGVDVFVTNPCDPRGRVYDYSPLWLVLARFPATGNWRMQIGLGIDLAYILSLSLLPVARSKHGAWLIVAGVLSSASVFAVERGNNDLVLFVLVAASAVLLGHKRAWRWFGYGCALLAGLLKYYPLALLLLATRERLKTVLLVWFCAALCIGLFVALTWHDLTRALTLIPQGSFFEDMFGAVNLGGGLAQLFGWPPPAAQLIRGGVTLGALGLGTWLGLQPSSHAALARLTGPEQRFLLAGSIMMAGCFFTAQNIGYRAVHIVLVLPALLALAQTSGLRRFRLSVPVALGLLWSQSWRGLVHQVALYGIGREADRVGKIATWGLREVMWWFLITLLVSIIVTMLRESQLVVTLLDRQHAMAKPEVLAD